MAMTSSPAPANKTPSARPRRRHANLEATISEQVGASSKGGSWLPMFRTFLDHLAIESRETGRTILGRHLWGSQARVLEFIAAGMDEGIRDFTVLKSRQLGETTICLAIDLFWLFLYPGIQGCILIDDESNRDKIRFILRQFATNLPPKWRHQIVDDNKTLMSFNVGGVLSSIDFLYAGTRRSTLGASRSYRFAHMTEVGNYGDPDGLENFIQTLSENHPDRLFIKEGTANGYNHFYHMCQQAQHDKHTQRFCFVGWWSRDDQTIPKSDPRYDEYMSEPWTEDERELAQEVLERYNHEVTDEQLCWYRWRSIARSIDEGMLHQTQPWTERQAFILSGRSFFPSRRIESDVKEIYAEAALEVSAYDFTAYRYFLGQDLQSTTLEQVYDLEEADLKVWEDPVLWGRYVIGVDPAYGRSDWNDSHAITVCRCYADRLVTVAEWGTSEPETYQVTWALAHIASLYEDCYINIEVKGPGVVIMNELRRMKMILASEMMAGVVHDKQWGNIIDNAKWYLWHRPDSLGRGFAYGVNCLALDTRLPTPNGWTTMGEIRVGDALLGLDGKPCIVTATSTTQENHDCYEIVFGDGTKIVADGAHLWPVHRHLPKYWSDGAIKLRTTEQLFAKRKSIRYVIPLTKSLELPSVALPIDPYTLGVWLGDGDSLSGRIYSGDQDIAAIYTNLLMCGQELSSIKRDKTVCYFTVYTIRPLLRNLDLINNKTIPDMYLRASKAQRLALLQGLMDTDGTARLDARQASISMSNPKLVESFSELLRTLGLKAKAAFYDGGNTIKPRPEYPQYIAAPYTRFSFAVPNNMSVFKLPRKDDALGSAVKDKRDIRRRWHQIVSINKVQSVPVKCVAVDSDDHLYLAGEGMIPTHNTTTDIKIAIMNEMRDSYTNNLLWIKSMRCLEQMKLVTQEGADIGAGARGRNHDDFVFSFAFAHRAWLDWVRPDLIGEGYTFAKAQDDDRVRKSGARPSPIDGIIAKFFQSKDKERLEGTADDKWKRERGL